MEVSRGQEVKLLDFYSIRLGSYVDLDGRIHTEESGGSFNSRGLLNLAYYLTKLPIIRAINHHMQVSYDYADWDVTNGHLLYGTHFETWNITISDIPGIRSGLQRNPRPVSHQRIDGLSFMVGANYESPLFTAGKDAEGRKPMLGFSLGVEVPFEPVRFGIALTESRSSDTLRFNMNIFSVTVDIEDVYYQLGLYTLFPLAINKWVTLGGGPQVQSPFLHRKILLEDDSFHDMNYGYNYGLRGGLEFNITKRYALRINYSYWIWELEYLLIEGYGFRPTNIQVEGRLTL